MQAGKGAKRLVEKCGSERQRGGSWGRAAGGDGAKEDGAKEDGAETEAGWVEFSLKDILYQ